MKTTVLVIFTLNLHLIAGAIINVTDTFSTRLKRQSSKCNSEQFECNDGTCIDDFLICDGVPHCPDESDETGVLCREYFCPTFAFRCTYGACIKGDYECNGVKDCVDNSDELTLKCPGIKEALLNKGNCSEGLYHCSSGDCIHDDQVCNGALDCADGSDETAAVCSSNFCPPYAFVCSYGACVTGSARCNGVQDCADNSDETLKTCGHIPTTTSTTTTTRRPSTGPVPAGSCPVPNVEKATITNVFGTVLLPGQYVPNGGLIYYKCQNSRPSNSNSSICIFGEYADGVRVCIEGCPTLALETLSVKPTCLNQNFEEIQCTENVPPGTIAQLSCKVGYRKPESFFKETLHCQEDGTWNDHVFKCEPICGEIEEGHAFIAGGQEGNIAQVPWQVAIYQITSDGSYLQICGGAIISTRAVLTAAHCFWNGVKLSVNDHKLYAAYAGKTKRDYYAEEKTAQKLIIKDIQILPQYTDLQGLYQGDIAVVVLDNPIIYQSYIKPVCLDFNLRGNERYINSGIVGRVAGWGLDQNAVFSPVLKIVDLPSVDYNTCKLKSEPSFIPFIGVDKFCVGTALTENVCQGDSGGGFVIPSKKSGVTKYFLRGLVSVGVNRGTSCAINTYTTFTDVIQHEKFFFNYAQN